MTKNDKKRIEILSKCGIVNMEKKVTEENVPFGGNMKVPSDDCEEAFFAVYPDFFYEGSTALNLWTQAWQAALDYAENKKPVIQLL